MTTLIAQSLLQYIEKIQCALEDYVPSDGTLLNEAARYSLLGRGKRFRPLLVLATTEAMKGDVDKAMATACAIEMIHTYSLIHDDLPCMDNDDYRRGRLTLHKVYREGYAVLAGDFLLTEAFHILANDPLLSAQEKVEIIQVIAKASSGGGLIGGQVLDLAAEEKSVDLQSLANIHLMKTGALIQCSLITGAILAQGSPEEIRKIYLLGYHLGLAFQIWDDVLDVVKGIEKHGIAGGRDQICGKSTYVSLVGLERATELAHEHAQRALELTISLPGNTEALQELIRRVTT